MVTNQQPSPQSIDRNKNQRAEYIYINLGSVILVRYLIWSCSMKRKILLTATMLCALTGATDLLAATIGPYIGAAVGRSGANLPNSSPFVVDSLPNGSTTNTQKGWAERGFAGYNFTPYLGIEAGYAYYARAIYNSRSSVGNSQLKYNFRDWDGELKVYLPLGYSGVNIYVLGGASYVTETLNYTNGGLAFSGNIAPASPGVSHGYRTVPIYGVGANVTIMKHVTFNFEFTQSKGWGNFNTNPNAIPVLNLATLGVAYNFGLGGGG
jgi:hypothetical protein